MPHQPPSSSANTTRTIVLDGRAIPYSVRRSPRATRVRLRVLPDRGLEVVLPARGRLPDIPALLCAHARWIANALDRAAASIPPPQAPLAAGAAVPYRGADYRLAARPLAGARPSGALDAAARTLTLTLDPARYELVAVLTWWYREEARAILTARADHVAARLGVGYGRLTIRDTRSRWGSCSSAGNLNFSWRLVLAPPAVLDYVVLHELAHRRELNHGDRFWALVAAHCPDYESHRAWLKEHGGGLMAFLG